jgi:hypothetical protein
MAHGHGHSITIGNLNFEVPSKLKMFSYILIVIGLVATIAGYIMDAAPEGVHGEYHHNRFWSNLFVNSFFFMAIALAASFFLALQYVAEAGWSITVKRVFEAVMMYLPFGLAFMLIIFLVGQFHGHHMYHWMDSDVYNPNSPKYDEVIDGKKGYFGIFWWVRTALYMLLWVWFTYGFRKRSLEADLVSDNSHHWINFKKGAMFMVIFAVTSSTASWDWVMSLDVHWYSTLFGWYIFSGMWITAIVTTILIVIYLKKLGYLEFVNDSTIHDLGKWMFAISVLWTYLWFSQFMLYWYADIPEEVTYFKTRFEYYKATMWGALCINFIFPMIMLISRDSKRNFCFSMFVGIIILFGHWIDIFNVVVPGQLDSHWHLGWMEVGMFAGFLGLFLLVVFRQLAKAPLLVKNHPYLQESLHLNH